MKIAQQIHHFFRRAFTSIEDFDDSLMVILRNRQSLLAALIGLLLLSWGAVAQHYYLIFAVLMAGAVGYWLGFTPAILIALAFVIKGLVVVLPGHVAELIVEISGITLIAWLGREHRLTVRKRRILGGNEYEKQVVSWTLVNEVRNSLLAMRLLLFQKNSANDMGNNLKLIEEELLRLEAIFSKIHDKDTG